LKNAVLTIFPAGAEILMPEVVRILNQLAESVQDLSTSTPINGAESLTAVDSQEKSTNVFRRGKIIINYFSQSSIISLSLIMLHL